MDSPQVQALLGPGFRPSRSLVAGHRNLATLDQVESELAAITERLGRVVAPTAIAAWLNTALPALAGDTPIERIASGDARAVESLISGLEDPGAS